MTYIGSITKLSSTYRFHIFGGRLNVVKAMLSKLSIKMLATTGDNGEPMGSPFVCTYCFSLNVNTVDLRQREHSSIRSDGEQIWITNLVWGQEATTSIARVFFFLMISLFKRFLFLFIVACQAHPYQCHVVPNLKRANVDLVHLNIERM